VENPSVMFKDVYVWEVVSGAWSPILMDFPIKSLGWLHCLDDQVYYFASEEHSQEPMQTYLTFPL